MIIKIPFKTPTINHLYVQARHGRRFLTAEAVKLKKTIAELVPKIDIKKDKIYRVKIEIFEDWLTKDGSVARKDISNREKFLIDSVFEALEVDDKYIFEHHLYKMQCTNEECSIIQIDEI